MSQRNQGLLLLLSSAFIYSTMPVLIRYLSFDGIPIISQVSLRYVFAFLAAIVYLFFIAKESFHLPRKHIGLLLAASILGYGMLNLLYSIAIVETTVSTVIFLFFTFTIFTPIASYFFLKEKINQINILSLMVSLVALLLLFKPTGETIFNIGGLLALLSSFAQTMYLVIRKKLHEYSGTMMMVINTFLGLIVVGALGIILESNFYFDGGIQQISQFSWITIIIFGVLNFLAWLTMTLGFGKFTSSTGSLILLSEIIFSLTFAYIFFTEVPDVITIAGGILIIIASALVTLKGK